MEYYFAPMEGVTGALYRRIHHKYFPGADAYYMPDVYKRQHIPRPRRI